MHRLFILPALLFILNQPVIQAQTDVADTAYISAAVKFLASDNMHGRVNFSKEQVNAAKFLYSELRKAGLTPYPGFNNLLIPFTVKDSVERKPAELIWNGKKVRDDQFYYLPSQQRPRILTMDSFQIVHAPDNIPDSVIKGYWENNKHVLIEVYVPKDSSLKKMIERIAVPGYPPKSDILITGVNELPAAVTFTSPGGYPLSPLYNIVGVLPGKTMKKEIVIFSAHYDHVNKGISGEQGEIYNGANDNASGVAAVLSLAKYYAARGDNQRTIVFCFFAGEELGLIGSTAFATLADEKNVKAVINIEMIGQSNVTGKNAFYISGEEYSTLNAIMSRNLKDGKVKTKWYNDRSNMFTRSDNYPFFLKGIPAHSIMCSDDKEPCYHKPCDDAAVIDYTNMAAVITAVAKGCETIISGKDTPVLRKR